MTDEIKQTIKESVTKEEIVSSIIKEYPEEFQKSLKEISKKPGGMVRFATWVCGYDREIQRLF